MNKEQIYIMQSYIDKIKEYKKHELNEKMNNALIQDKPLNFTFDITVNGNKETINMSEQELVNFERHVINQNWDAAIYNLYSWDKDKVNKIRKTYQTKYKKYIFLTRIYDHIIENLQKGGK